MARARFRFLLTAPFGAARLSPQQQTMLGKILFTVAVIVVVVAFFRMRARAVAAAEADTATAVKKRGRRGKRN